MKNIDLSSKYDQIYKGGAYSKHFSFNFFPGEKLIIDYMPNWVNLKEFSGAKIAYKIDKGKQI